MAQDGRARGERGAVVVEFAFISILLVILVFGIISFGLILSFKQDMTRAAAEGARAGAVALPPGTAAAEADQATRHAVEGFGQRCGTAGMTCNVAVVPCGPSTTSTSTSSTSSTTTTTAPPADCVSVELVFDYKNHPILPKMPGLAAAMPETIRSKSVARINQ